MPPPQALAGATTKMNFENIVQATCMVPCVGKKHLELLVNSKNSRKQTRGVWLCTGSESHAIPWVSSALLDTSFETGNSGKHRSTGL